MRPDVGQLIGVLVILAVIVAIIAGVVWAVRALIQASRRKEAQREEELALLRDLAGKTGHTTD